MRDKAVADRLDCCVVFVKARIVSNAVEANGLRSQSGGHALAPGRARQSARSDAHAKSADGPLDGDARVGLVAAVGPSADRHLEVTTERRVDFCRSLDDGS